MVKRAVKKVEYERSSGNVFRNLGFPMQMNSRSSLAGIEIAREVRGLGGHLKQDCSLPDPTDPREPDTHRPPGSLSLRRKIRFKIECLLRAKLQASSRSHHP